MSLTHLILHRVIYCSAHQNGAVISGQNEEKRTVASEFDLLRFHDTDCLFHFNDREGSRFQPLFIGFKCSGVSYVRNAHGCLFRKI